jgi:hypothetical protein
MDWITKALDARPLSVALLVCLILALGLFWLIKNSLSIGRNKESGTGATTHVAVDLAALAERVTLLEHDMQKLEPKVNELSEEFIEWRTVLQGLKESMNESIDRLILRLDDRKS